jgi:hypothetical protein
VAASVWRYLGFNLVVTFGALQSVSSDQYDAARLEGGNGWPSFWRITFRSIRLVQLLQFALLRNETRAELKRLHQRLGATTVYVTHDQHEAMTLAGRGTSRMAGGNGHQHPCAHLLTQKRAKSLRRSMKRPGKTLSSLLGGNR